MKPSKTLIALLSLGLMAGLVIAWNPSNLSFNTNQFLAVNPYVNIKSGVNLTNVIFWGSDPLDASNLFGSFTATNIVGIIPATNLPSEVVLTTNKSNVFTSSSSNAFLGTLSSTNVSLFATTVANLGTPDATVFPMKYASDVITPYGVGGYVFWDGTNWRTRANHIIATADMKTFILNCLEATVNQQSELGQICIAVNVVVPNIVGWPRTGTSSGANAALGIGTATSRYGYSGLIDMGTTTSGKAYAYSFGVGPLVSGDFLAGGGFYYVSSGGVPADQFWCVVGLTSTPNGAFPTSGAFFLYDPGNVNGLTGTTSATNDWWAVNGKASTYTAQDTGLAVTTSSGASPDLMSISTTTNSMWYTNGVLCAQSASNIPIVSLFYLAYAQKTAGTTDRFMGEGVPYVHYRRAAKFIYP